MHSHAHAQWVTCMICRKSCKISGTFSVSLQSTVTWGWEDDEHAGELTADGC